MAAVPLAVADIDCRERSSVNVTGIRAGTRETLEERNAAGLALCGKPVSNCSRPAPPARRTKDTGLSNASPVISVFVSA